MPKFRKLPNVHQVTIDEYLRSQEELFPDGPPAPSPAPYTQPWIIPARPGVPLFPGAVDAAGAPPAPPAPAQVVYSRFRRRAS